MPELVADVGNTRIKLGLCGDDGLTRTSAVPLDDSAAWAGLLQEWVVGPGARWVLAGTHPGYRDRLADWLRQRGDVVSILDDYRQVPIRLQVEFPEKVGIDRLLNAVAAEARVPRGIPIVLIDAGSAVTVDLVDSEGAFRGGAIFPGFRLMAKALNDYTAKLPLVEDFTQPQPPALGTNTVAAITSGISHAIQGGIDRLVKKLTEEFGEVRVLLAGGNSNLLVNLECRPDQAGPYLTLEGVRIAGRNLGGLCHGNLSFQARST